MEKLRKLPGMRDLTQESWTFLQGSQDKLRAVFTSHGYQVLETPLLEPTELFLRKTGGEIAAQLYSFSDPGGNAVSLRPEFTPSIMRYCLEYWDEQMRPARIQYAGPVFRHGRPGEGYHQFTQVGLELLGSASSQADSEILSLACLGLTALGLKDVHLVIGDVGVYSQVLEQLTLSERARVFVLSHVTDLKEGATGLDRVRDKARKLGLLPTDPSRDRLSPVIGKLDNSQARELVQRLAWREDQGPLGQRRPEEVVERLLRKLRGVDDPSQVDRALEMAASLACIEGEAGQALVKAKDVISRWKVNPSSLDRLAEVVVLLSRSGLSDTRVLLDLGLARGIAYYTGIVFELRHAAVEGSLGGGGRYDGLAKTLGSDRDVPALGFAYTLERVVQALQPSRSGDPIPGPRPGRPATLARSDTNG